MVPDLEAMGIRLLLNEFVSIERAGAQFYLAGIDDAHYFRVDNIEKAASGIPHEAFSILLSHTPEIYRQAAHAGFDVCRGHTHGGQICFTRIGPHHARVGSATQVRRGRVGISRDGRIHLSRRRIIDRYSAHQLPPRNHIASSVACRSGGPSIAMVAQP